MSEFPIQPFERKPLTRIDYPPVKPSRPTQSQPAPEPRSRGIRQRNIYDPPPKSLKRRTDPKPRKAEACKVCGEPVDPSSKENLCRTHRLARMSDARYAKTERMREDAYIEAQEARYFAHEQAQASQRRFVVMETLPSGHSAPRKPPAGEGEAEAILEARRYYWRDLQGARERQDDPYQFSYLDVDGKLVARLRLQESNPRRDGTTARFDPVK